jgi:hypothetical protein
MADAELAFETTQGGGGRPMRSAAMSVDAESCVIPFYMGGHFIRMRCIRDICEVAFLNTIAFGVQASDVSEQLFVEFPAHAVNTINLLFTLLVWGYKVRWDRQKVKSRHGKRVFWRREWCRLEPYILAIFDRLLTTSDRDLFVYRTTLVTLLVILSCWHEDDGHHLSRAHFTLYTFLNQRLLERVLGPGVDRKASEEGELELEGTDRQTIRATILNSFHEENEKMIDRILAFAAKLNLPPPRTLLLNTDPWT